MKANLFLLASGVITAVPLVLFGMAARQPLHDRPITLPTHWRPSIES
jgi:hypothetical protein